MRSKESKIPKQLKINYMSKVKKMQDWEMHVQFNAIHLTTKARTKGEARRKMKKKLRNKDIVSLIDNQNSYLDKAL